MINFIICEDDNKIRSNIKDFINKYIDMNKLEAHIPVNTILYNEVLEYVEMNWASKNIYILDIDLNDSINGLQLARKIREHDINGYIIFVTGHIELSLIAYKYRIKVLDFIVKNVDDIKSNLYEAFDVAIKELERYNENTKNRKLIIKVGSNIIYIEFDDIICIETAPAPHKLILYTANTRIEFYGTLKKICKKLDNRFYQIHRSCVINTESIKKISKKENDMHVIMENNNKHPLSKKYVKELTKYILCSN